MLETTRQTSQPIDQMIGMIRNSQDPQAMVESMLKSNPRFSGITLLLNQNKSYKEIFYDVAKQRGVDPDIIVRLLHR